MKHNRFEMARPTSFPLAVLLAAMVMGSSGASANDGSSGWQEENDADVVTVDLEECRLFNMDTMKWETCPPVRRGGGGSHSGDNDNDNEQEPEPEVRPVLLIHGFYFNSTIDCADYFDGMVDAIRQPLPPALRREKVVVVGWYANDFACDDYIVGRESINVNTDISDIAQKLADYIQYNYSVHGIEVDIVAHSLGGLIVRSMLQERGDELLVPNVVTLGTPHAGATSLPAYLGCAAGMGQCRESMPGSAFLGNLEHNPQSSIPTHWTIVGSELDGVIGPNTSIQMMRGPSQRPQVIRHQYDRMVRDSDNCWHPYAPLGHGDLVRDRPTRVCPRTGGHYSVDNPTDWVLNALR